MRKRSWTSGSGSHCTTYISLMLFVLAVMDELRRGRPRLIDKRTSGIVDTVFQISPVCGVKWRYRVGCRRAVYRSSRHGYSRASYIGRTLSVDASTVHSVNLRWHEKVSFHVCRSVQLRAKDLQCGCVKPPINNGYRGASLVTSCFTLF